MSKISHKQQHGSVKSYLIGFILSVIFSIIPYYLVVNQVVTGNLLLVTILEFAVIQTIIQITFFLHIGRGPKPDWNLYFFVFTVGIILIVAGGSIFIMNQLNYNMSPASQVKKIVNDEGIYQIGGELTGACQQVNTNHVITIQNNQVYPYFTEAFQCDTITFINLDENEVKIAFGEHDQHINYAGEDEITVSKSRNETITLSETGNYVFHNHYLEETAGEFTVISD